jgi:YfiH family protein
MFIEPEWSAPMRVRAVMTTRQGGVSVAPWNSLNLGVHVGDNTTAVLENRRRVRKEGGLPSEPVWLEQVHGTAVVVLEDMHAKPESGATAADRPRADAAVTSRPGVVCAIQVADCMPVLFAASDGSVVGAAHAGWRGLAGGVLEATVEAMRTPPSQIVAWLGPAIGPQNFEVGDDVVEAFKRAASVGSRDAPFIAEPSSPSATPAKASNYLAATEAAFTPRPNGKWLCDLYTLARLHLAALGITEVNGGGWCTVADAARFFSYRRDGQTGRMAALVWINPGPS